MLDRAVTAHLVQTMYVS